MRSIRLFDVFGITIKLHTSFLLLLFFFGFSYARNYGLEIGLRVMTLISLVFVSVTFHELCHSLQARRYGVKVRDIVLYPIGGVASMQSIPDNPKQEFMIAIVGPLSNLILAALLYFPLYYLIGPENLFSPSLASWPRMFANAFWLNPILAAFNLLPAFPMDGGRVFRAFLAQRMDYQRATHIAVGFGHFFAFVFGFIGLAIHHYILIIIGVFVYMAASSEGNQVDIRYTLKKFMGNVKERENDD